MLIHLYTYLFIMYINNKNIRYELLEWVLYRIKQKNLRILRLN